jgi:hypothetical protein
VAFKKLPGGEALLRKHYRHMQKIRDANNASIQAEDFEVSFHNAGGFDDNAAFDDSPGFGDSGGFGDIEGFEGRQAIEFADAIENDAPEEIQPQSSRRSKRIEHKYSMY